MQQWELASNTEEEMYAFAPGGGALYNFTMTVLQGFFGVYKGFNVPSPGTARDDGTPVEKETSLAKEVGFRYMDSNFLLDLATAFHTYFEDLIVINNSNSDSSSR